MMHGANIPSAGILRKRNVARRILLANRFRGSGHDVDLYVFGTEEAPLVAEVKSRRSGAGFVTLEKWLGGYDCLFLRRDSAAAMVLLPWRVWAALLARVRR
jgi:hypothetical protein